MPIRPLTPFERLVYSIASELSDDDFQMLTVQCEEILEKFRPSSANDLFKILLRYHHVTECNIEFLIGLLEKIRRKDLLHRVRLFATDRALAETKKPICACMVLSGPLPDVTPEKIDQTRTLIGELIDVDKSQIMWVASRDGPPESMST